MRLPYVCCRFYQKVSFFLYFPLQLQQLGLNLCLFFIRREDYLYPFSRYSTSASAWGNLCYMAAYSPKVCTSGVSNSLNLGGRYLCYSYSLILVMILVQVLTFCCGITWPMSSMRWFWRVVMSLARSELYFSSSLRVGKPLYIDIIRLQRIKNFNIDKKMFNYMGASEETVEQGVKQFGLAVGARKMIDSQYDHAADSLTSGLYITYWNEQKKSECFRLGKHSKCFCGHLMPNHNDAYFGKKFNTTCQKCACKRFQFVPTRPEECGMYWLVRRKDFDVSTWRPPCKCKHTCQEHSASYPLRCKKCSCSDFTSNFACLTCDGAWQDHQVLYEREEDRKMLGKKVGEEYMPLSTHKHIQKQVFNKQKYSMIKGRSLPNGKEQAEKKIVHDQLNWKRPTKAEQAKLKTPLGFIFQPKYPQFMKK